MEQCEFPRCRCFSEFVYICHDICDTHWEQICSADSKTEKCLLKKIGLVRNKSGSVVPIIPVEKS